MGCRSGSARTTGLRTPGARVPRPGSAADRTGPPGRRADLLDRLAATAANGYRDGSLIEVLALRAIALDADGRDAGARGARGRPGRAETEGWIRVFVDEGPPMAALLGKLAASPVTSGAAGKWHQSRLDVPPSSSAGSMRRPSPGRRRPTAARTQRRRASSKHRASGKSRCSAGRAGTSESGDRERAVRHGRHGEEARDPRPRQAGRRQPNAGRCPRPFTRAHPGARRRATNRLPPSNGTSV